jgi:hypothetical protein
MVIISMGAMSPPFNAPMTLPSRWGVAGPIHVQAQGRSTVLVRLLSHLARKPQHKIPLIRLLLDLEPGRCQELPVGLGTLHEARLGYGRPRMG